jgi:DNA (cytosine-5)-methyltransferase 1
MIANRSTAVIQRREATSDDRHGHLYIINRIAEGLSITKTPQVAKCGNSVCPPLSEAQVRANAPQAQARAAVAA